MVCFHTCTSGVSKFYWQHIPYPQNARFPKREDNLKLVLVSAAENWCLFRRKNVSLTYIARGLLLVFIHPQGLHYSFQTSAKLYFVLDYVNGGEVGGLNKIFNNKIIDHCYWCFKKLRLLSTLHLYFQCCLLNHEFGVA